MRTTVIFPLIAINLLLCPVAATAASGPASAESPAEIVIQEGMAGLPSHISVAHRQDASYMEIFREDGEQLWRKPRDSAQWQVLRRWTNRSRSGYHTHHGKGVYNSVVYDGRVDIYDSHDWSLVLSVKVPYEVTGLPGIYFGPPKSSYRILKVPVRDENGRPSNLFWFAQDGKHWRPLSMRTPLQSFWDLRDGFYAGRSQDGQYRIYKASAKGFSPYSTLPGGFKRIDGVQSIGENLFAIGERVEGLAKPFDRADQGMRWHIYHWSRGQWRLVSENIPKPEVIRNIVDEDNGYFYLRLRGATGKEPLNAKWLFHVDEQGRVVGLSAMHAPVPQQMEQFISLANGLVIGAREHDDQNQDGEPGSWTWLQHSKHGWQPIAAMLNDPSQRIDRVVEWHEGKGLGIQTTDKNAQSTWNWWLQDAKGDWQPLSRMVPELEHVAITRIDQIRDGLYAFIEGGKAVDSPPEGSRIPLINKKTHWFMQGQDGSWAPVDGILQKVRPELVGRVVSILARENSLVITGEPNPGDPLAHLILYRERSGNWRELDTGLYQDVPDLAENQLLPRAKAQVDIDSGVVLLERQLLDGWYAGDDASLRQALYKKGGQWYLMPDSAHGGDARLKYDAGRKILVRDSSVPDERTYFLLDKESGWQDIRLLVPQSPKRIADAYAFLDGRGLAIQEQGDANHDGKAFQWSFYLRENNGWRSLADILPDLGDEIRSVTGIGANSLSVQTGAGWRYFTTNEQGIWFDIRQELPALPGALDSVHVSNDGLILTAREVWDANGNGDSWETFAAVRQRLSDRFAMLNELLPKQQGVRISNVQSLWQGKAVAVETVQGGKSVTLDSGLVDQSRWTIYSWQQGKLAPVNSLPVSLKVRSNLDGSNVALQNASGAWKLFGRNEDGRYVELHFPAAGQVRDIVFDDASGYLGVKVSDMLNDGEERWQWWSIGKGQPVASHGYTAEPFWWSYSSANFKGGTTGFDRTVHTVDGQPRKDVPTPELWIHRDAALGNRGKMIYAPDFLNRIFGQQSPGTLPRIDALGIGKGGSVILYRIGTKRFATAFSNGLTHIESRSLHVSGGSAEGRQLTLLVNQGTNGLLRLVRMDQPQRWIWGYGAKDGMIYFDEAGNFYSDSDLLSRKISFRKGIDVYSLSQFGNLLFRPDLLERALDVPRGSLFEMTQRDREHMENAVRLASQGIALKNVLPPQVKIADVPARTTQPYVEITLNADGYGIDKNSIIANIMGAGRARGEVVRGKGRTQVSLSVTKKVPLVRGLNVIKLSVYDANGLESSQYVKVDYDPKNDRKPTLWAAVIATKDYASPDFGTLPMTQNDANTIRKIVEQQSGKLFERVELKTWCQSEHCNYQPTRSNIADTLPAFLQQAKNGDYIELFVSGHGIKLGNEFYIVPADGDLGNKPSLISWSEIQSWLQSAALGKKVVFLDTCQSGAVFGSGQDKRRMIQQSVEDDGIYVLSATAENASAYELPDMGNGLFTYVVKEGLTGKADNNADGLISFEDFSFFLARRVRELSTMHHVRMEPGLPILKREMDFELVSVDRKKQLYLRVVDVASFDGAATPERLKFWRDELAGMGIIVVDTQSDASMLLNVVENNGQPLRAQLTDGEKRVLSQWSFQQVSPKNMLTDLEMRVADKQ